MKAIAGSLVLAGFFALSAATHAADSCKECQAFLKVCLQAHSKAASQTDYNICKKHCQQK